MGYFEYRDLAPIDNIENGDKYIEALNWAFQNKKVKNIALTGPYGAGKSSVIETFIAQDDKKNNKGFPFRANTIRKKSLKISMATFFKGKALENAESGEKIEVDADEVEKGILKQLFYKVEPGKIPQSRYRKIHKIKLSPVMVHIFGAMTLITFLSAIFAPEKYNTFVQTINNFLSIESAPNIKTYSFMGILFLVTAGVIAYLYRTVISRFRIKEVKLPSDTTIQSGREESDSVFNKNLDEIMYFFEATGYRIVFFEDLDRLDSPKIFVHLRELNNLLNNDDAIKGKPIVFVYAVRDDIFSKEDRTKFFDFIIPIVPVINETNSGEILLQRFQEAKGKGVEHNISQEFVLDVSPYVSDMRVLQNIYNEFVIYKDTLRTTQELSLSDEQMLAMIIFKNIHPSDFADIQSESGVIKQAFEDKQRFISAKKQEMQAEIDDYETAVERYQADSMKSVREIKYAMFGELMGRLGTPESIRKRYYETISADKIMQDNFDLAQLLSEKYDEIHYYYGSGYSNQTSINKEMLESYIERWKEINRVRKIGLQEMQEKLQQLRMQQHDLSGLSIAKLLEEYLPEEVLSETVRRNKLLVFLLRRAYIDEKYASYINYFKGTSITKDDMNFILSVKNQEPLAFDYQLTKVPMVIQRLQEYEFEEKAIYNFTLLEELLSEGESVKLSAFINQLSDEEETSWRFIDEFFSYTKQREQFIQLLTEKWTGMWTHISADATMTYDHKLEYLCEIMNTSLMYQRNNKNYEMLINICYFVLDGMLQTTDKGNYKMMTFSDEHMHRLYEKFVLEYFKRHHSYLSEVRAAQVKWNLATDTEESMIRFLPAMQTDIFLRYKEKVLIIDTKYYGNSMQKQYDKVTIHSGNMYQIFTYVKNQDVENNGRVSGMLLYAKTEEAITPDCSFVIGGNKISVKTVDLNKEFKLIAAQLDKIAEDYFGKKRIEDSII